MAHRTLQVRRGCIYLALQAALLALAVRLITIQALQHPRWRAMADAMERDRLVAPARRGPILDRNGHPLAVTITAPSVFINPKAVPSGQRLSVARKIAEVLGVDTGRILSILQKPKYFAWVRRKVPKETADALMRLEVPGLGVRQEPLRRYPYGTLLCHALGFVGTDNRGLAGLEARYDDLLAGVPGEREVLRDGLGRPLGSPLGERRPPVDGKALVLTVDVRVQRIVEEELARMSAEHRPESACAVVLDPRTGDVLAMAGWPAFDPQRFQEAPERVRRNMAVAECVEPGSTFKPFVAAVALEHGAVSPDTVFDCRQGRWRIGRRVLHDAHPYGRLTVRDIVAYSSNIGMAQVAARLDPAAIYYGLRAFGFGSKTGIELPGETAGILRPPEEWSRLSRTSIAMGQEVAVSPLQLAAGFCVFANGGWYVRPRIVLGVADSKDRRWLRRAGRPRGWRALSRRVADLMGKDLLVGVVERGTARRVAIRGYPMAGKTGTAQIARPGGGGYEPGAYVAAFVGIVPADAPRFVVAVVVRRPGGRSHYGGVVAAPAVARMAERILSMHRVPRAFRGDSAVRNVLVSERVSAPAAQGRTSFLDSRGTGWVVR